MILLLAISIRLVMGADPTVGVISSPSSVNLNSGASKFINCNATVTDLDGYQNITNANATFFDTTASGSDDNNNHYTNSSCTLSGGAGNTTTTVCGFSIQYYANPAANWECNITATDGSTSASNTTGQTITVQELKALSVAPLSFTHSTGDTIPLGNTSIQESLNITNLGNINITLEVNGSGTAMDCAIGTVPLANMKYNISSGFAFSTGIALTSTVTNVSNLVVAQQTDDSSQSVNYLYWLLQMPGTGVEGDCTGSITINAN